MGDVNRWGVEIPLAYPSANVLMRKHWAARAKLISRWLLVIDLYFHRVPKASSRRRVEIVRNAPRLLDRANLWLGADKLILDNLVKLGILKDDSEEWLDVEVQQKKTKKNLEWTSVTIADII